MVKSVINYSVYVRKSQFQPQKVHNLLHFHYTAQRKGGAFKQLHTHIAYHVFYTCSSEQFKLQAIKDVLLKLL